MFKDCINYYLVSILWLVSFFISCWCCDENTGLGSTFNLYGVWNIVADKPSCIPPSSTYHPSLSSRLNIHFSYSRTGIIMWCWGRLIPVCVINLRLISYLHVYSWGVIGSFIFYSDNWSRFYTLVITSILSY